MDGTPSTPTGWRFSGSETELIVRVPSNEIALRVPPAIILRGRLSPEMHFSLYPARLEDLDGVRRP